MVPNPPSSYKWLCAPQDKAKFIIIIMDIIFRTLYAIPTIPQPNVGSLRVSEDDSVDAGARRAYKHVVSSIWQMRASRDRRYGYLFRHEHGRWIWISIHSEMYIMSCLSTFLLTSSFFLPPSHLYFPPSHTRTTSFWYTTSTTKTPVQWPLLQSRVDVPAML